MSHLISPGLTIERGKVISFMRLVTEGRAGRVCAAVWAGRDVPGRRVGESGSLTSPPICSCPRAERAALRLEQQWVPPVQAGEE